MRHLRRNADVIDLVSAIRARKSELERLSELGPDALQDEVAAQIYEAGNEYEQAAYNALVRRDYRGGIENFAEAYTQYLGGIDHAQEMSDEKLEELFEGFRQELIDKLLELFEKINVNPKRRRRPVRNQGDIIDFVARMDARDRRAESAAVSSVQADMPRIIGLDESGLELSSELMRSAVENEDRADDAALEEDMEAALNFYLDAYGDLHMAQWAANKSGEFEVAAFPAEQKLRLVEKICFTCGVM